MCVWSNLFFVSIFLWFYAFILCQCFQFFSYLFCIIILCKCVSPLGLLWQQGIPPGSRPVPRGENPRGKVLTLFLFSQFGSPRFGSLGLERHCFPRGNPPSLVTPGSALCLGSRDSCYDASISLGRHRPELVVFQTVTRSRRGGKARVSVCH